MSIEIFAVFEFYASIFPVPVGVNRAHTKYGSCWVALDLPAFGGMLIEGSPNSNQALV
jgi:hypothetical protein